MIPLLVLALATSPWSPSEWRMNVDIGREPGTSMPDEWAAQGSRLPFDLSLRVESDYADDQEEHAFMGKNALRLVVIEDPTFVTMDGEQVLSTAEEAAWKVQLPKSKSSAGTLRFWIDLTETSEGIAACRNDVELPSGRLFFLAQCWREPALKKGGVRRKLEQESAEQLQQRINQQLSHENGDRRLDGTNPLETVQASIEMAALVKARNDRLDAIRSAPPGKLQLGHWPGHTDKMAIARGTVAVKKRLFFREEFQVVGKFSATPVHSFDHDVLC